jgi:uncharacterized SAM-binding protein YcdF (DUF218 family)
LKQKTAEKVVEQKAAAKAPLADVSEKKGWGLWRRRECLMPTWRGWLALAVVFGTVALMAVRGAYNFLAVTDPRPGGVLVVEGWAADYALEAAVADFKQFSYEKVYVTGGPIEYGAPLSSYKTYAELGTATLLALGMSSNVVQPVPAPRVKQDRTYACALALKKWMDEHGVQLTRINLVTVGTHARRSRLLFQKSFGKEMPIGIVAIPEPDYDTKHWWRSSLGFRAVTGEAIAYLYARFLFRPTQG